MTFKKDHWKTLLKLFLGGLVVVYVLKSKMVDFEKLHSVLWSPVNLALAFTFLSASTLLCAARWRILVKAQNLSLPFWHLVELTLIGNFFNTFMPGAVGGDLIKAWYVAGREPERKTLAIFTVLLDRILGLTVILFYSSLTLLFFTEWLSNRAELKAIATSLWAFSTVALIFAGVFFASRKWTNAETNRFFSFFRRWRRAGIMLDATLRYRHHFGPLIVAFCFSAISILGVLILYKLLGDDIGIPMSFPQYLFLIPLAMTVTAVPLLPGGFGVGQVAFFTLFKWMGMPDPDQGGTLCTLVQIYTVLFSLLGLIPYLRYRRSPHPSESEMAKGVEPLAKASPPAVY